MTYDIESDQEELVNEIAPDTPLPKDLIEHLESRKQHRKDVINTTDKLTRFFVTWSLNSTGLFIAKYLLITGGGVNLWLAITLSFSICRGLPKNKIPNR